jgi:hypothetical protein
MHPLQLARRVARAIGRRVRLPFARRRTVVTTALSLAVLGALAASAHAAVRAGAPAHAPSWLFSKLFHAIGQLLVALGDWFASIGR